MTPRLSPLLDWLLSGERFRSRVLGLLVLAIVLALLAAPFLFPGARALTVAARICIFAALVASYDLLLGYTGIVSFAHTVFFGAGAYGVAIALKDGVLQEGQPGWGAVVGGGAVGVASAMALAFMIGLLTLRVRNLFYSMVTLAVASLALLLASQLSGLTGGEDGITFGVPELLSPGARLLEQPVLGLRITGQIVTYYGVLACSTGLFLFLLRVVNSPFGRVLQAIRENDFRAEALGFRVVLYRSLASCLAAGVAALAGVLAALWTRYTGPNAVLSFSIMMDILLMLVIGGMGSMYGALIGATVLILAQYYLPDLMAWASAGVQALLPGVPLLAQLLHPDRWLLWLGVSFVLIVYFFPNGIVGRLRKR